ncbi:EH domain-containing protein 3 isoform X2 [Patella vulgata]|uniref:EH domain-containing protein 3 isoform X2 n=1 Tax=Patella vulgata TaxID=6465 RepID=UPI002180582D|nr:EH domain-containing protein 3 isoform X2 [Patella vulgata]
MKKWLQRNKVPKEPQYASVIQGVKELYNKRLRPLEDLYNFKDFHSPPLDNADFDAKPMVLLLGQKSVGKTTFIRYLLEQDYPGMRIGPEPTTDRFIAIMKGDVEDVAPGNAAVADKNHQYQPLTKFGNAFLNRFQIATMKNIVLDKITFLDTPGVLSGEKQRRDRGYDFCQVVDWLGERVDRIILLFDAHKLDISDEFADVINTIKKYDDKIRIVLNKADEVTDQELVRVYGALMWALGKVMNFTEVPRVYMGSFWDQPLQRETNRAFFEAEEMDLFKDLQRLPSHSALRKLNDLVKRARLAKVHAYIISHLKKEMPSVFGKDNKKKELINKLQDTFDSIQREHQISPGDFPNLKRMQEQLQFHDFTKFHPLKPKLLENVDNMLATEIARLMQQIPLEEANQTDVNVVHGGAFEGYTESPFGIGRGEGIDKGRGEHEWVVAQEQPEFNSTFERLNPINGKITGAAAKSELVKSKLPNSVLSKVWKLADVDKDGMLDQEEWALANHLIKIKLEGHDLPADLPDHLIPPSKRDDVN